jgi:uncharacterized protein YjbI with pentapeptide repeats
MSNYVQAVEYASTQVRKTYFLFVLFSIYFAVSVFQINDNLMVGSTEVKVPLLILGLQVQLFFSIVPVALVGMHSYLMLKCYLLSRAVYSFDSDGASDFSHLAIFPFNHFILRYEHPLLIKAMLSLLIWLAFIAWPLILLLITQYKFLPYHDGFVTGVHQALFISDILVVGVIWPMIVYDNFFWENACCCIYDQLQGSDASLKKAIWSGILLVFTILGWRHKSGWLFKNSLKRERFSSKAYHVINPLSVSINILLLYMSIIVFTIPGDDFSTCKEESQKDSVFRLGFFPIKRHLDIKGEQLPSIKDSASVIEQALGQNISTVLDDQSSDSQKKVEKKTRLHFNMKNRDFSFANFQNFDFSGLDISGTNFRCANIKGAIFNNTIVNQDTSFRQAKILNGTDTDFHAKIKLLQNISPEAGHGIDFRDAELQYLDFSSSRIPNANFRGAKLEYVKFVEAELQFADFEGAELLSIDWSKALLCGARFVNLKIFNNSFINTNLTGALFSGAKLEAQTFIYKTILDGAVFYNTNLKKAHFSEVTGIGAMFINSSLQGSKVIKADLTMAVFCHLDFSPLYIATSDFRLSIFKRLTRAAVEQTFDSEQEKLLSPKERVQPFFEIKVEGIVYDESIQPFGDYLLPTSLTFNSYEDAIISEICFEDKENPNPTKNSEILESIFWREKVFIDNSSLFATSCRPADIFRRSMFGEIVKKIKEGDCEGIRIKYLHSPVREEVERLSQVN